MYMSVHASLAGPYGHSGSNVVNMKRVAWMCFLLLNVEDYVCQDVENFPAFETQLFIGESSWERKNRWCTTATVAWCSLFFLSQAHIIACDIISRPTTSHVIILKWDRLYVACQIPSFWTEPKPSSPFPLWKPRSSLSLSVFDELFFQPPMSVSEE